MGKKTSILAAIFEQCKIQGNMEFDNKLVKQIAQDYSFGNPFDATKADSSIIMPEEICKEDYFLLHLGGGRHKFIKGLNFGYHEFEEIEETKKLPWPYRKSLLNEVDTSESNILSVASNQRILHDFLFEDIVASPKNYNSRRTQASFSFYVGAEIVSVNKVQIEIDLTMENQGDVIIFEAKNKFPKDFAVYQIYYPIRYFCQIAETSHLDIKSLRACYVLRKRNRDGCSVIRLYLYTFENIDQMDSIKLIKSAEYKLYRR